ncbi:MAG TPA: ATP-binding cassette domain-containing protein [Steroidobacteraceae bacterium]|nr:ATP-binding cassette domain-containing protein [Steroidobacteraceae bacterium]
MRRGAALIELSRCSVILGGHVVLDEIDFALRRGERWALIGPNGSGKTFLLKMLRGDVWPTPTGRERRDSRLDKEQIAYVGPERQDKYVRYGWDLTVAQIVTTGLFDEDIPLTQPSRSQRQRVSRVLQRFGLTGLRRRRMLTLSYGQRRLVLVARAFAGDARVLLLDEVFNGLDARAREKLQRALERPRAGHDWVLTSHRPKELPANVTHVARIARGRIIEKTTGRERKTWNSSLRQSRRRRSQPTQTRNPPVSPVSSWLVRISNASIYRDYRPVIRDLNWTLRAGEHWAVLGANGAGKSTLLSLIYGDLHPALGGAIERAGLSVGERIENWKQRVAWVSPELQADHYAARSIEEVVISGRYSSVGLNEPPTAADKRAARRWLKFFGITELRDRGPRSVSYGQMRLALLARAMVNDPQLLLLDEPCTGLDGDMRAHVLDEIERLASNGTQIVMAVHDAEDIVPAVRNVLKIRAGKAKSEPRPRIR